MDAKNRPEIPDEEIIQVKNSKKIDFTKPYQFIYYQWWYNIISFLFCFLVVIVFGLASLFFYGVKVVNRKKVRKIMRRNGCIVVTNHCHYLDTLYASVVLYPRRMNISVVQRNMEVPIARTLLWLVRCFPIPGSASGLKMITKPVEESLKKKDHVLFMPEGNMVVLSQKIYRFRLGAFHQSYIHQAPMIPQVYVLKRRRILGKEMPRHWVKMILIYGDPILPPPLSDDSEHIKVELQKMADHVAGWMEETIQTYQAKFKKVPVKK